VTGLAERSCDRAAREDRVRNREEFPAGVSTRVTRSVIDWTVPPPSCQRMKSSTLKSGSTTRTIPMTIDRRTAWPATPTASVAAATTMAESPMPYP